MTINPMNQAQLKLIGSPLPTKPPTRIPNQPPNDVPSVPATPVEPPTRIPGKPPMNTIAIG